MKKSILYSISLFFILFSCSEKKSAELFKATDFTAENLFTNNIEGPAFDAEGNLYVVNFGEDGTIGKVDSEGNASLFLTLPEGSTANSIKFGKDGTMYLADYTGHNVLAVDMATKAVSTFAHNDAFNQPNDLCIDRQGRLFASDPNWGDKTGQIWRIGHHQWH